MKKLFSKFTAIYLAIIFLGYIIITMAANHLMIKVLVNRQATKIILDAEVFTRIIFVAMSGMSLVAMIIFFIFNRRVNRQFQELNLALKEISDGNFKRTLKVDSDDEMGELADNVNKMSKALYLSELGKQKFISNISHDLRSPLTSIIGYIKAIQDGTISYENQDRYLKIILKESERLKNLINDILELSKFQNGQIPLSRTEFDINQMIIQELDSFESRIIDKRLRLHLNLSDCNIPVYADKDAMRRVVYNLLDNALKFIDEGGSLKIYSEKQDLSYIVGIQNTGAVIPKDNLNDVWDRFYKMDLSRGKKKDSSGLGLSIVKEIIKVHGEKIDVYSDEKEGVLFLFSVSTKPMS